MSALLVSSSLRVPPSFDAIGLSKECPASRLISRRGSLTVKRKAFGPNRSLRPFRYYS